MRSPTQRAADHDGASSIVFFGKWHDGVDNRDVWIGVAESCGAAGGPSLVS